MVIGVLKEPSSESRVSLLPDAVVPFVKTGIQVMVEPGAGERAFSNDDAYSNAGATIVARADILRQATILLSINKISEVELSGLDGQVILGIYQPLYDPGLMRAWANFPVTVFSLDMLPRTTRAQSMDVLSSQANIAGYKAVVLAAATYSRYFPMFMTAAGSVAPARMLILGAGVAGLQAIATARRLGAVVEVFDTRPAVKEEVMSLGAKFIEVEGAADASAAGGYAVEQSADFQQRQQEKIALSAMKADIIITTAQIPGRSAPVLIPADVIEKMRPGSVIIDLAAATGGNTALTKNDQTVVANGVTIIGNSQLAASLPSDASKLYGKNISNFLSLIINKDGGLDLNFEDDLVKGACIIHNNEIVNDKIKTQ